MEKATDNTATAKGVALPISTKTSVEICNYIRHMKVKKAKDFLTQVIAKKAPLPMKKFIRDLSHKKGVGPGRFPEKSSTAIKDLLDSAEANAQFKGLNTSDLEITHTRAYHAARPFRYGRQRRRKAKRTSVEIVIAESAAGKAKTSPEAKEKSTPDVKDKITPKAKAAPEKVKS